MNMTHVTPFLKGMDGLDSTSLESHLSEDVVLFSPFTADPFVGKEKVLNVLRVLLSAVDEFETTAIIAGDDRRAGAEVGEGWGDLFVDKLEIIAPELLTPRPPRQPRISI